MSRRFAKKWRSASYSSSAVFLFLLALLLGAIVSVRWITATSTMLSTTAVAATANPVKPESVPAGAIAVNPIKFESKSELDYEPEPFESPSEFESESKPKGEPNPARQIPFSCSRANESSNFQICPSPPHQITRVPSSSSALAPARRRRQQCPSYFRWIHEDLRPWRSRGITRAAAESARGTANFRLVILGGRAYVERYRRAFQSRDVFTLWGVLQLLRRYPGRVPDVDLMFDCVDWPVVDAHRYRNAAAAAFPPQPPPLFRYCGNESTLDIVFPDWSFWGWPEIDIKPWEELRKEIEEGNKQVKWMDREPYAYWKGNPAVAETRQQLLKCNVSDSYDWNARIYAQDWLKETHEGFKESNLASQCVHRYKIYIEGSAWSVSQKYIMACDSLTLLVKPNYYDFFTRGLMPVQHYWPIREDDKCRSIKFAVDWGNSHKQKAQSIGKEASDFIQENLKMDYVYDYMLHLLTEYSKLLRYKPTKPPKAVELCAESMACSAEGLERKFMMDSMASSVRDSGPCELPPPFKPAELKMLQRRKDDRIKQVEMWEQRAWENRPKKQL